MPRSNEPGRSVSSRVMELLFAFLPNQQALSLADLVRRTGLPHATARRLLHELAAAGAVEQRADGKFTIGLRLWQLGTLAPHTESLRSLAQPVVEDLYVALHQHVQLAVLEGDEAVIIERLSAREAVGLVSRVGGRLPLHASAVGKVLLAHGGAERRARIVHPQPRRFTPTTITDPAALEAELETVRRTGIATVREELTPTAESVATRILDGEGTVVAALSVVLRAGSVDLAAAIPSVVASGLRLSRLVGWRPGITARDA